MHRIPVKQIMTKPVIAIHAEDLVVDAANLMEELDLRRLPVVDDDDCLVGIVTDSDILQAEAAGSALNNYEPEAGSEWLTVADIMTRDVFSIDIGASVGELAMKLIEHKVGGMPVVEHDPRYAKRLHLVGIVTETDVFRMIAEAWEAGLAAQHQLLTAA